MEKKTNIVKEIFSEEKFPRAKEGDFVLKDSFNEKEFSDKDQIIKGLKNFRKLPSLK